MTLSIAVLVSVGRHPASGRTRRADADARALELALRLVEQTVAASLVVAHAGDPEEPSLRGYLGMGLDAVTVLQVARDADPTGPLTEHLRRLAPDLVLTGSAAEAGAGSGFLPYVLAQALGYPLAPGIVAVQVEDGSATLLQALPRGRRRSLQARLPLVVTVDKTAPAARASAHGPARRGRIVVRPAAMSGEARPQAWIEQPARPRPRRLRAASGGSAAERLKRLTETPAGRGQLLVHPAPEQAAEAIYQYLVAEGIIASDRTGGVSTNQCF